MTFKDHFSGHAEIYADARPSYPDELFAYLGSLCAQHDLAWDCATGNGQAAVSLAGMFSRVIATDGSAAQIERGQPMANIEYRAVAAEEAFLKADSCDLITVAQALHWFDHRAFFENARACLKPGGVVAAWCYGLHQIGGAVDSVVNKLYEDILGDCWPGERRLVENHYRDIPFPFEETDQAEFLMTRDWNLVQLCDYFNSWSAVQRYKQRNARNPIALVEEELLETWGGDPMKTHRVTWPLTVKMGRKRRLGPVRRLGIEA